MRKRGLIFVISGPSGSGKTTLIKSLLKDKEIRNKLTKSISFTTRAKRRNEKEGKDYSFISKEQFKELLKRKKILEWTKYLDYYYGTPKDYIDKHLKKGKHIALCLDTKGAASIKRIYPDKTVAIFILPPKIETLKQRILSRSKGQTLENLRMRLNLANKEIAKSKLYDHRIINDNFSLALRQLKEIVMREIINRV